MPDYSENIGRIAAAVEWKYPGRGFGADSHTSKILKLDAGQVDESLLEEVREQIADARPVLFLPNGTQAITLSMLDHLIGAGYRVALLFDDKGAFIQTISLDAREQFDDLSDYVPADVCAFHAEDADLCSRVRQMELEHRRANRKRNPPAPDVAPAAQELAAVRAHTQLDRYRLQLQIAELETRISAKDAEINRLQTTVRDFLRTEHLKALVTALRSELNSSLALRAARSLHWILAPIRKTIGGNNRS